VITDTTLKMAEVICDIVIAVSTGVGFPALYLSQTAQHADEARRKKITAIELNERFSRDLLTGYRKLQEKYVAERRAHPNAAETEPFAPSTELLIASQIHGNSLESFALYVENGLVDERLIFRVAAKPYCEQVKNLATLCGVTDVVAVGYWQVIYDLYARWSRELLHQAVPYVPESIESTATRAISATPQAAGDSLGDLPKDVAQKSPMDTKKGQS
jgi:hypothetical protein